MTLRLLALGFCELVAGLIDIGTEQIDDATPEAPTKPSGVEVDAANDDLGKQTAKNKIIIGKVNIENCIKCDDGLLPKDMRTEEYKMHCLEGHPFDPRCPVCIQGNMRAKRATTTPTDHENKARPYQHHLETAVTDNLKLNATDIDGNKAVSGVLLPRTSFGEVVLLKSLNSVAKDSAWKVMQRMIHSIILRPMGASLVSSHCCSSHAWR